MRWLLQVLVGCLWLLAAPAMAQTIYKCAGPGGQVVFQQQACPDGKGGPVEVRETNTVEGNPAGDAGVRARAARSAAVDVAVARGRLLPGMSDSEVRQVLGHPTVVNTDVINGKVTRQYVYRYADGSTRYAYTGDDGLYAIQNRPAITPQATEPCYSESDLRSAEMASTSISLSAEERTRRAAKYRAMASCRR